MKLFILKPFVFAIFLIIGLLAACSQPLQATTSTLEEQALFTDADIDKAQFQAPIEMKELVGTDKDEAIEGLELSALADGPQDELSTQAILPNASGFVFYANYKQSTIIGTLPYNIYRHDQKTDLITLIYSGYRQIQSVAGSWDGKVVVVSMRETSGNSSDYEIYMLLISDPANPEVLQLTNDAVDNTNVSMSNDIRRIVYEEPIAGKVTLVLRTINGFISYDRTVLSRSFPQRQASVSSDGRFIALVRDLADGSNQIMRFNMATNGYASIATSSAVLEYPSISDDGNRVLWLQNGTTDLARFKNLRTGTTQTVVSAPSIGRPFLTANGGFMTYQSGRNILTKNLYTAQVQTIASSSTVLNSFYAPMWQKTVEAGRLEDQKVLGLTSPPASYYFGNATAIDGNLMVVGAPYTNNLRGAAYILQQNTQGVWSIVKTLVASGGVAGDQFGFSVAISGTTVVIGSYLEDHSADGVAGDEADVGAAYIFQQNQGGTNNWGQVKKLIASDDGTGDYFGWSVAASGSTVVVGAYRESHDTDNNGTEEFSGAAYIFQQNQGGTNNWGQLKKLLASDDAFFDLFGMSVAVEGSTLVVGASQKKVDTNADGTLESDVGAAYIFQQNQGGTNTWGEVKKLVASDRAGSDIFGRSVDISGDTVVVGADLESHDTDGNGTLESYVGAVYVFRQNQGGSNVWGEVRKLVANDDTQDDRFGLNIAISGDTVVVGVPWENHDTDGNFTDEPVVGAAYLFGRNQGGVNAWGQVTKLVASDAANSDRLGEDVDISNGVIVVGATGVNSFNPVSDVGAVYIYK